MIKLEYETIKGVDWVTVDQLLAGFKAAGHEMTRTTVFNSVNRDYDTIPNIHGQKVERKWRTPLARAEAAVNEWKGFNVRWKDAHAEITAATGWNVVEKAFPALVMRGAYGLEFAKYKKGNAITVESLEACIANYKAGIETPEKPKEAEPQRKKAARGILAGTGLPPYRTPRDVYEAATRFAVNEQKGRMI